MIKFTDGMKFNPDLFYGVRFSHEGRGFITRRAWKSGNFCILAVSELSNGNDYPQFDSYSFESLMLSIQSAGLVIYQFDTFLELMNWVGGSSQPKQEAKKETPNNTPDLLIAGLNKYLVGDYASVFPVDYEKVGANHYFKFVTLQESQQFEAMLKRLADMGVLMQVYPQETGCSIHANFPTDFWTTFFKTNNFNHVAEKLLVARFGEQKFQALCRLTVAAEQYLDVVFTNFTVEKPKQA